ncbi:MAG: endo alpha-1,4 polygalactosaminidase [Pikeienuella sp.]
MTDAAGLDRKATIAEAISRGVGIQYWGPDYHAAALARARHGLLMIEAARIGAPYSDNGREIYFSADEVREIRDDGRQVILGYINVSEIETYRDYWSDAVRAALGGVGDKGAFAWYGPKSRHGELLAKYWTPEWEEVLAARVDRIMAQGYDGVLLDDVLHYYTFAGDGLLQPGSLKPDAATPEDAPAFARAMMRLVTRVADRVRAHDCDALVVVNNGAYIGRDAGPEPQGAEVAAFDAYRAGIDGILMESLFSPHSNPEVLTVMREDYQSRGVSVLTIDFASFFPDESPDQVRSEVAARAREHGFAAYVADNDSFDRLYEPIIGR